MNDGQSTPSAITGNCGVLKRVAPVCAAHQAFISSCRRVVKSSAAWEMQIIASHGLNGGSTKSATWSMAPLDDKVKVTPMTLKAPGLNALRE